MQDIPDPQQQQQRINLLGKVLVDTPQAHADMVAKGIPEDKIVLASSLPGKHRILSPGAMRTMDHQPERLNLEVDAARVIRKVTMG
ncbi:hypothetical protein HKX48_008644 [Thoreauomyces humboldtii]|nr:hypothetical protein HKX48_008644 [Thoreauomyces humboldtii]